MIYTVCEADGMVVTVTNVLSVALGTPPSKGRYLVAAWPDDTVHAVMYATCGRWV